MQPRGWSVELTRRDATAADAAAATGPVTAATVSVSERRGQFSSLMPFCTPGREPIRSPHACRCFKPALSGSALRPA